jgi:hypothetical protein
MPPRYVLRPVGEDPIGATRPIPPELARKAPLGMRWIVLPPPLAELKAAKLAAAEAAYQAHRQSPFHWDFGAVETLDDFGVGQGPAGAQTLQMRDTPEQDDLKNWGFAFNAALAAAVAGAPQTLAPLKTSANVWVQTTAAQAMQVLMTGDGTQQPAFARGVAMLAAYGLKKAEIGAAADAAALAGVDVEAGWPG